MRRLIGLGLGCCVLASPLYAALKPGAQAPAFTTPATLAGKPFTSYSNRTSYVIAPDGTIIYEYTALNPDKHVENTMAAVAKWQAEHKKGG